MISFPESEVKTGQERRAKHLSVTAPAIPSCALLNDHKPVRFVTAKPMSLNRNTGDFQVGKRICDWGLRRVQYNIKARQARLAAIKGYGVSHTLLGEYGIGG